jgi:hypothetical protein
MAAIIVNELGQRNNLYQARRQEFPEGGYRDSQRESCTSLAITMGGI